MVAGNTIIEANFTKKKSPMKTNIIKYSNKTISFRNISELSCFLSVWSFHFYGKDFFLIKISLRVCSVSYTGTIKYSGCNSRAYTQKHQTLPNSWHWLINPEASSRLLTPRLTFCWIKGAAAAEVRIQKLAVCLYKRL